MPGSAASRTSTNISRPEEELEEYQTTTQVFPISPGDKLTF
jgi:hypothetical protein